MSKFFMVMENYYFAAFLFFVIAVLYASVGHAGASGYLAVMSLLAFAPSDIKFISLMLNSVVASIASYKYIKMGFFDARIFKIFIVISVPMAFLGGHTQLNPVLFKFFAGIFLVLSALFLVFKNQFIMKSNEQKFNKISVSLAVLIGAIIGFVSGLIGVGGGIFLSPIILFLGWTSIKNTFGISALFILCNSIAGLLGQNNASVAFDFYWIVFIIMVAIGGIIGSYIGGRFFYSRFVIVVLFIVLMSAGVKFIIVDSLF